MYGRRMGRSVVRVISGRVAECVSQCQPGGSVDRVVTRYGDIQRIHLVFRAPAPRLALVPRRAIASIVRGSRSTEARAYRVESDNSREGGG